MVESQPLLRADTPAGDDALLQAWAERIRAAAAGGPRLRIRGGGSKAFYGNPLDAECEVLDTQAYAGIVNHEPTELVVTARCGTPLAELEAVLARHGQCLPFEPPHFGPSATVGGMVAAGLAGPARAAVGAVRDYVLGVRLLDGRGEDLHFGGQVMKNVAGYDVSRALAGSLGTLGVITEVSLKVLPVAAGEATLCAALPADAALERLAHWRSQPLPLNASLWSPHAGGTLWLRLRGAAAAVEAASERLLRETGGQRLEPAAAATVWHSVREQTSDFFAQPPSDEHGLWRLSVAPTTPMLAWPGDSVIEWFGGQRWVWAPVSAAEALRALARQGGGHATLFRPPAAQPEAHERFTPPEATLRTLQQRVRAAFDPHRIFQPGIWGY
ncbi:glycolate oxidase subunit GlcE [uncultured Tepidimonas sp.]|uniref:glycolate oxidase subunit GlcE n=1 Tax=uncultured Tepidimonas sp. TaxID=453579 RepID=UPI002602D431|nr:glycolate oxidase subunit GlcE [uncultured Tepidimonas sp.]